MIFSNLSNHLYQNWGLSNFWQLRSFFYLLFQYLLRAIHIQCCLGIVCKLLEAVNYTPICMDMLEEVKKDTIAISWLYTLTCLINSHARLFFSEKFETLPAFIAPCPFINFLDFAQPARLWGLPIFHFVPFPLATFIDTMTKSYPNVK